jgi:hypothetical protein
MPERTHRPAAARIRNGVQEIGRHYLAPRSRSAQARNFLARRRRREVLPTPLTHPDPREFADALTYRLRLTGLDPRSRVLAERVVDLISQRLSGADHTSVTSGILDRTSAPDAYTTLGLFGSERLFGLAHATRSAGLFIASGPLETAALSALEREVQRLRGPRKLTTLI